MSNEVKAACNICGEPMPAGEEVFNFHGYSGPCPKPPLMQPHQRSVVEEKKELDERAEKLRGFLAADDSIRLVDDAERLRMTEQYKVMREYSRILDERILHFPSNRPRSQEK